MQIALQASADSGGSPVSWQTIIQTSLLSASMLGAGVIGQFQVPPVPANWSGEAMPRFYRLLFNVGTSTFSAGNITSYLNLNPSQATKIQDYPGNYVA